MDMGGEGFSLTTTSKKIDYRTCKNVERAQGQCPPCGVARVKCKVMVWVYCKVSFPSSTGRNDTHH